MKKYINPELIVKELNLDTGIMDASQVTPKNEIDFNGPGTDNGWDLAD